MASVSIRIAQQGSSTQFPSWDEINPGQWEREEWKRSATLWPESWLSYLSPHIKPPRLEIFLLLNETSLDEGYNKQFIQNLIECVRRSIWEAEIRVVLSQDVALKVPEFETRGISQQSPAALFETLLEEDIADVLQWNNRRTLIEAAARSALRMKSAYDHEPGKGWKCFVRTPPALGPDQEAFLRRFLIPSLRELNDENCLIVLQGKGENYIKYLKRALGTKPNREVMVGIIDQVEKPPRDLEVFCQAHGYALVWFHGLVELYYFLLRLNKESLNRSSLAHMGKSVRVITNPTFRFHAPPQLLITHAYVRGRIDDSADAARDVWEIKRELGADKARIEIYPAATCIKLAALLNKLDHVLVWVHIGHGKDTEGLQQAEDGIFKTADDWLSSFASYHSSLALALFSSCRSASVAEHFAKSGAGVAIGYTEEVFKKACKYLTKGVVKAAIDSNGYPDAILKAFWEGRQQIASVDKKALPVAFWGRP